jgi:manganese efflux pump family protein
MPLVDILLIAVGLAMDAFAVSLAAGASRTVVSLRPTLRLAFHLGLFQALMPILGWFAGSRVAYRLAGLDHWLAFALLAVVGVRMVRSGLSTDPAVAPPDPSRGLTMVMVSLATSVDAFAIGLSLAMIGVEIWQPAALIGLVTAVLSLAGIRFGAALGVRFGKRMEIVGGLVLVVIGIRIVAQYFGL